MAGGWGLRLEACWRLRLRLGFVAFGFSDSVGVGIGFVFMKRSRADRQCEKKIRGKSREEVIVVDIVTTIVAHSS